jgi:hypothetical protein
VFDLFCGQFRWPVGQVHRCFHGKTHSPTDVVESPTQPVGFDLGEPECLRNFGVFAFPVILATLGFLGLPLVVGHNAFEPFDLIGAHTRSHRRNRETTMNRT